MEVGRMKENGIIFTLEETLEQFKPEKLTRNKLAVEAKVRPATIADITKGNAKSIQLDTLVKILNALNRISFEENGGNARRYTVEDVFIYGLVETDAE
jgi:DNA-binding Xre family transcriptional regulator